MQVEPGHCAGFFSSGFVNLSKARSGPSEPAQAGFRFQLTLLLNRFGSEETWLPTGWDDVESGGANAGNASGTYAPESSGIRSQEGADSSSLPPHPPPRQRK
jgi:hypothetical protein